MKYLLKSFTACLAALLASPSAWSSEIGAPAVDPVELLCIFRLKPEKRDAFLSVMKANVRETRKEPGNVRFELFEREGDPNTLYLYERWKSQAALDWHMQQPYLKAVLAAKDGASREPETFLTLHDLDQPEGNAAAAIANPEESSNVAVIFEVKDGSRDSFLSMWKGIPEIRKNPAVAVFSLHSVKGDPSTFVLFERWQDKASHQRHFNSPQGEKDRKKIDALLSRPLMESRQVLDDISE